MLTSISVAELDILALPFARLLTLVLRIRSGGPSVNERFPPRPLVGIAYWLDEAKLGEALACTVVPDTLSFFTSSSLYILISRFALVVSYCI